MTRMTFASQDSQNSQNSSDAQTSHASHKTDASATPARPVFPKRAVVTCGMPYGNKNLHFGHIGGVFVPADFFARFLRDRIGSENVLFVSGTDCFGSPIMEGHRKLAESGYTGSITDYVRSNHDLQKRALDAYGISLDLYTGSGLDEAKEVHQELTSRILTRLYERGYLHKLQTKQFYDAQVQQFLNGRQVLGRCPVKGCKSEKAYADECDLGHQFDPEELIAPVSALSKTTPELRPVDNWYFDLPAFKPMLEELMNLWDLDPHVRDVVTTTVRESLAAPRMYIQDKFMHAYQDIADQLPEHTLTPAQNAQSSFTLEFDDWKARDRARELLEAANIRYRTGKTLLPFRITGNISWGVKAPELEDTHDLTVWCWPESLWAPISFSKTALMLDEQNGSKRFSTHDWRKWWCAQDASVYQFLGQDNIYFYCVAQPALWDALDWDLFQDTPFANYHILFMNKKASSSGAIKPPMAEELLDSYTAEELRCHWLSLALDQKAVSFAPKVFDSSVSYHDKKTDADVLVKDDPRVVDPALKESAFLSNIFNRLARSCFYGAQNACNGCLPQAHASESTRAASTQALLDFEASAAVADAHSALGYAEKLCRLANKQWGDAAKKARDEGDDKAYEAALADAFCALKAVCLMMHPAVYKGCEDICAHLNFDKKDFFSWDNAFLEPCELAQKLGDTTPHKLIELPARFDFFKKHEKK